MLSIEEILAAEDVETREVRTPEWKGSVHVRTLTAAEQLVMFEQTTSVDQGTGSEADKRSAKLAIFLAAFLCDGQGKPLATREQAQQLVNKSARAVQRIVKAGHKLNQSGEADLDDIAKN